MKENTSISSLKTREDDVDDDDDDDDDDDEDVSNSSAVECPYLQNTVTVAASFEWFLA